MPRMAKIRSSGKSLGFTKKHYHELAAVVYANIFGFPLTVSESRLWAIRKTREKYSLEKFNEAEKITRILKKIPTVEAIFLTGSAAASNAKKTADADLMIITSPNSVWLTRAIVFIILKFLKKLKNPLCPNIFLDLNHLEIKDKNLFTAHEVLQAKCLYDHNGVEKKWLEINSWTREYLPKVFKLNYELCIKNYAKKDCRMRTAYYILHNSLFFFELVAFILQYVYQKPRQTCEKLGWGCIFFHPNNLSEKVLKKFEKKFKLV